MLQARNDTLCNELATLEAQLALHEVCFLKLIKRDGGRGMGEGWGRDEGRGGKKGVLLNQDISF